MPEKTLTMVRSRSKGRRYKRRGSKKDSKMYSIAKRVSKTVAKRELHKQVETHYYDWYNSSGVGSSGLLAELFTPGIGDSDQGRTGDNTYITSIHIRGLLYSVDQTNVMRVMLIQTKGESGLDISSEVIQSTYVGQPYAPFAPYSKDFAGYAWVILADICLTGSLTYPQPLFEMKLTSKDIKKKGGSCNVQFAAGSTVPTNGALFLVFYSDSGAITHPVINYVSRVRFKG